MKTHVLILVFILGMLATVNAQIPTNGLIGSWPFNGNANDESGNGQNGTVNGATLTMDRFGNTNSAFLFDGENDYIDLGNIPQSSHSYTGWFKINGRMDNWGWGVLISKLYNYNNIFDNDELSVASPGYFSYETYRMKAQIGNGSQWEGFSSDSIPIDSTGWHNFVYTYDDYTKNVKLYIDNILVDSNIIQGYSDDATRPTYIGARPYWGWSATDGQTSFYFNGYIDDVRIYNRALDLEEINSFYFENMCIDTVINDTIRYHVSDLVFEDLSPKVFLYSIDSLITSVGGCDSIIFKYLEFVYEPNYFTDTIWVNDTIVTEVFDTTYVTITDTTFISVTDTLIIDVNITGVNPPVNLNTLKVYPNPAKDYVYINTGLIIMNK